MRSSIAWCIVWIVCFGLLGCAQKEPILQFPSQNLEEFVGDFNGFKAVGSKEYLEAFFSPWSEDFPIKPTDVQWGLQQAMLKPGFGENLLPYSLDFLEALKKESHLESFPSVKRYGIITRSTNVRVLPTNKPRFFDPKLAGEGFPFDYWQNSYIYLGTPIIIRHYSLSGMWAYVESGFVSGWVNVLDIGILTASQVEELKNTQEFLVVKEDYTPLKNAQQEFLEYARIGMLLPWISSAPTHEEVAIYLRDSRGYAQAVRIEVSKESFERFPMVFSATNVASLAQQLVGEKYGWGGMFGNRDCSMLLRDVLGNFGLYLPRNSQAQMSPPLGEDTLYWDLSEQDAAEKKDSIKRYGIPFGTLLGMKGHILLYLGEKDGEIYALHDVWGLRTLQKGTEGRKIIGKVVITSLEIGKDVKGIKQDALLLDRLYGMRNLLDKATLED